MQKIKKTKGKYWILGLITIVLVFLMSLLSSCGGGAHIPFSDIPDANLEDEYYMSYIQRYSRHEYIYSYLVMKHDVEVTGKDVYDTESPVFKFFEQVYSEWKENYPDKVKVADDNYLTLVRILTQFTSHSMPAHFESMKEIIDSYIKYVYLDDLSEKDNYETYVSESFREKQPKERVSNYLAENNIKIVEIDFNDYFSSFEYHAYPLRVIYDIKITYYIGDEEVPEKNWKTTTLKKEYFIGRDNTNNYIIKYISDPAKEEGKEIHVEGELHVSDIPDEYEDE